MALIIFKVTILPDVDLNKAYNKKCLIVICEPKDINIYLDKYLLHDNLGLPVKVKIDHNTTRLLKATDFYVEELGEAYKEVSEQVIAVI